MTEEKLEEPKQKAQLEELLRAAKIGAAEQSASKSSRYVSAAIVIAWAAAGYLSYLVAQYVDLYLLNESLYFSLIDLIHPIFTSVTAKFFLYHSYYMFSSLALAFLFAGLLATVLDFRLEWLAGFYAGAAAQDIWSSWSTYATASEVYESLPAHLTSATEADLLKFMLLLPLVIFAGVKLGRNCHRYLKRKMYGAEEDSRLAEELF